VLPALALWLLPPASAGRPEPRPARRVYVLHSGVHVAFNPSKNRAAETLRRRLLDRGVPDRDLVVLDNPFPTASWANILPRESLVCYLESMDPNSAVAHDAYRRLHAALRARGVTPADDLVWVGHSAGGQVGLTMARLAHDLDRYPDLAKTTAPYHFDMVITLGSAVCPTAAPTGVRIRHYHSPADSVAGLLFTGGEELASVLGYSARFCPAADLTGACKVRVFDGVTHHAWYRTDHVIDAILAEHAPPAAPAWRRAQAECRPGPGLSRLLCHALDETCHVSLEDPRAK
jgi:pimeloyl-ACP methyl ester carboxylesterase